MGINPYNTKVDIAATLVEINKAFPTASPVSVRKIIEDHADGCVFGNVAVVLNEDCDGSTYESMMVDLGKEIGDDDAVWDLVAEV